MNFCFLIYNYFPYGGQQRDFLRIAKSCVARGHQVKVYTLRWQGEIPPELEVSLVPVKSASRLKLYQQFSDWVGRQLQSESYDLVLGFNKMPHLDVYFAADSCFADKAENQRGAYYKFTPRFRHFMNFEQAVFGADSKTRVFTLSPPQQEAYIHYYPDCAGRLYPLPPGIGEDRQVEKRDPVLRKSIRDELSVGDDEKIIVAGWVRFQDQGSGPGSACSCLFAGVHA
jgi:UDP-glucose:(heptosyl)LPS alpha-1,3-glucosyltransferase